MLRAQLTSTAALAGCLRFNSIEDYLMYFRLVAASLLIVLASASSVQAQMSLGVSKITCDQFVHHKVGSPRMIAAWLSGYYNAKRNNLTIDLQNVEAMADKVEFYCENQNNWAVPVMQAIERLSTSK
jgi:acid stress chaperone HdeB